MTRSQPMRGTTVASLLLLVLLSFACVASPPTAVHALTLPRDVYERSAGNWTVEVYTPCATAALGHVLLGPDDKKANNNNNNNKKKKKTAAADATTFATLASGDKGGAAAAARLVHDRLTLSPSSSSTSSAAAMHTTVVDVHASRLTQFALTRVAAAAARQDNNNNAVAAAADVVLPLGALQSFVLRDSQGAASTTLSYVLCETQTNYMETPKRPRMRAAKQFALTESYGIVLSTDGDAAAAATSRGKRKQHVSSLLARCAATAERTVVLRTFAIPYDLDDGDDDHTSSSGNSTSGSKKSKKKSSSKKRANDNVQYMELEIDTRALPGSCATHQASAASVNNNSSSSSKVTDATTTGKSRSRRQRHSSARLQSTSARAGAAHDDYASEARVAAEQGTLTLRFFREYHPVKSSMQYLPFIVFAVIMLVFRIATGMRKMGA